MFMTTTEHVARHQVAALSSNLEPAQRQRLILRNALPVQQDLSEQRLSFEYVFTGGDQNRLGCACGAFLVGWMPRIR